MRDCNDFDVHERAAKLCSIYPTDLDGYLSEELIQFRHFVKNETLPVQLLLILRDMDLRQQF